MTTIELDKVPALRRDVQVMPSMCGHNPALYARIGDWTWDTVGALCGVNVPRARSVSGAPTYLSFFYYRLRGSDLAHPHGLEFGDELTVTSASFDFGSEAVHTLHRIGPREPDGTPPLIDLGEFYGERRDDCLYVENMNRWVSRSMEGSNQGLEVASPDGFRHWDLPRLPGDLSPRRDCGAARKTRSFHPEGVPGATLAVVDSVESFTVDVASELNGVGLLYFASFFAYVDRALLRLWRDMGRDNDSFLAKKVLDLRVCYFGNADAGQRLEASTRLWQHTGRAGRETAEVVIRDGNDRLLAVAAVELLTASA
ncbi:LnmK family bifunctional acyltransferase/decarboxylase [Nocardia tengchongensis]|uniref:LnmK family bifunctional acyltransferase/decarboxylase n=1 Tax=Nocardia tengchongensis TaxID=2055889 RepID=UPI0036D0D990